MNQEMEYGTKRVLPARHGVYYAPADSPGTFARLFIAVIGFVVVCTLAVGMVFISDALPDGEWRELDIFPVLLILAIWGYLVPLKRSRIGTLGYRLFGVRVVELQGCPAGLIRLTFRTLMGLAFNPLLDLVAMSSDDNRRGLRDKLCGTCVVRSRAQPVGTGRIGFARFFFMAHAFTHFEVIPDRREDSGVW